MKEDPILLTNFAGLILKNPLILASGGTGWDGEHLKKCAQAGAGAVIPKSIGPPESWQRHPRCGRIKLVCYQNHPIGMVNIELFSTLSTEAWIKKELRIAREGGAPVIASMVANPDPEGTTRLARVLTESGLVSMIELNVSCPMPVGEVGFHMGQNAAAVMEQTRATKEGTNLPVMVKLTPLVSDIAEIAASAVKGGADAIAATNSFRSLAGVDVETGVPYLSAFGGYTGPAMKPIVMRCVADIVRKVTIPVSAIGGVSDWRDVVEYLMVGAKSVQICTAVMWRGLRVFKDISSGITQFMERKGYHSIEEMIGVALKHLHTVEELSQRHPMVAQVKPTLCNGCRLCQIVCSYGAVDIVDRVAVVDEYSCDGCGLCIEWCKPHAIQLVDKATVRS